MRKRLSDGNHEDVRFWDLPERLRARHPKTRQTGHQPPICAEVCADPPNLAPGAVLRPPPTTPAQAPEAALQNPPVNKAGLLQPEACNLSRDMKLMNPPPDQDNLPFRPQTG